MGKEHFINVFTNNSYLQHVAVRKTCLLEAIPKKQITLNSMPYILMRGKHKHGTLEFC
jgi:hypothetical protein